MTETLHIIRQGEEHLSSEEFTHPADRIVDSWLLMSSPVPIIGILLAYLYFVLYLGPRLMENRKPFELKYTLIGYNFFNVLLSCYLVWQLIGDVPSMMYIYNHICAPMERSLNPFVYKINASAWAYFFSKVIELADTVFFVMRKKQNQVTVLHVYHHANMVASTWAYLKYIRGEQALLMGFINSFVHIVMYSYYLLAALGPRVQKYLWWKKYITKMQLGQFVIVLLYSAVLLCADCQFPKGLTYYAIFQATVFLGLFLNFYKQTYIKKNEKSKSKES